MKAVAVVGTTNDGGGGDAGGAGGLGGKGNMTGKKTEREKKMLAMSAAANAVDKCKPEDRF